MRLVLNMLRGMLIGVAEIIPGVSGGTVALVVGVYRDILGSAESFLRGLGSLFSPRAGLKVASPHFASVKWAMLLPLLVGMVLAVFLAANVIEDLLSDFPSVMRAVFAGMILISLYVPWKLSEARISAKSIFYVVPSATLAFVLIGLPRAAETEPTTLVILLAAAVAVCALVLPGVSGSFLLLTLGMYAPTLAAVNSLDFGYLGVFVIGALLGLGSFTFFLNWLLRNFKTETYLVMTGLMIGSLRALWPWQDGAGNEVIPGSVAAELVGFSAGAAVVALLIWGGKKATRSDIG